MGFNCLKERLVSIGYPAALREFEYDASFPVRGLWFDKVYGNLLKVDSYGNILVCVHGFHFLKHHEIEELYPNKFMQLDDARVYVLNTLFNLPDKSGLKREVSTQKKLQTVKKCNPVSLLRSHGAKTVLITNSDYEYTHDGQKKEWSSYWDCVVVDARKPLFFAEGTILRRVDRKTGALEIGHHQGPLKPGDVYSGGSCDVLSKLLGARGKDVLYVGDHIYGDILKSKKIRGWRTFLIVPELMQELRVWTEKNMLFSQVTELEASLSDIYK
nr:hypothetical protein BaRGS_008318 [Batillaria attramentaria]